MMPQPRKIPRTGKRRCCFGELSTKKHVRGKILVSSEAWGNGRVVKAGIPCLHPRPKQKETRSALDKTGFVLERKGEGNYRRGKKAAARPVLKGGGEKGRMPGWGEFLVKTSLRPVSKREKGN